MYVEGSLQTRKWDKDGQTHYTTEIKGQRVQFLDRKGGEQQQQQPQQRQQQGNMQDIPPAFPSEASGMDDVPF